MAIDSSKTNNAQYACKIIDLRKQKPKSRAKIGRWETPAKSIDVDEKLQLQKIREMTAHKTGEDRLRRIKKQCWREAEVLKDLNHVRIPIFEKDSTERNTAEYHWF